MATVPRLLVCAPHTDDAELGCGAAIAKLVELRWDVHVVAFSRAEESLPPGSPTDRLAREMGRSLGVLGIAEERIYIDGFPVRRFSEHRQAILERLIRLRSDVQPDLVMAPSAEDVHQDHAVVSQECVRAFRACGLWGYELPWNQGVAHTTGFVVLEERHIALKERALACYESQTELFRPYFQPGFMRSLAIVRGLQIKQPFAEAFSIVRSIL